MVLTAAAHAKAGVLTGMAAVAVLAPHATVSVVAGTSMAAAAVLAPVAAVSAVAQAVMATVALAPVAVVSGMALASVAAAVALVPSAAGSGMALGVCGLLASPSSGASSPPQFARTGARFQFVVGDA